MKDITHITAQRDQPTDHQAISLEEVIRRKIQRRRRVAKRMLKRFPLFAVQEMQQEFPGYQYDEWVADVTRKTRKGKSFRRPKKKGFDWKQIRKEIPEFFYACKERSKTKARLRFKMKSGLEFTCVVRSVWNGDYGENRLRTTELIRLWRGTIQEFTKHPAVLLYEHKNEMHPIS